MPVSKILPPNTIAISNLKSQAMEKLAENYDVGHKGYLTFTEACSLFADKNDNKLPGGIDDVVAFLGGAQHPMTSRRLNPWEAVSAGWLASEWKGDFHLAGFGAGNIRTGRQAGQAYDPQGQAHAIDRFVFLVDCNLVEKSTMEKGISSATLVVGPKGFGHETGSNLGEAVELPLTLATEDGHMSYDRSSGTHWVDEKKYLAAAVDTTGLRELAAQSGGLSFYVRLETPDGKTLYINRDGQAFNNFEVGSKDLKPVGAA